MSPALYEKIADALTAEIESGHLAIGSNIPSVSELRKQYQVSHITVLKAFQELVERQLIIREPGRGYRVATHAATQRKLPCYGMLLRNISNLRFDQYYNSMMCGFQAEAARRGYSLLFSGAAAQSLVLRELTDRRPVIAEAMAMSNWVDGFALDEWIPDVTAQQILELTGKPGVIINRPSTLPGVRAIYPDYQVGLRKLYATLMRLGYNYFVLCDSGFNIHAMHAIRAGFQDMIRDYQLPPEQYEIIPEIFLRPHAQIMQEFYQCWQKNSARRVVFIMPVDSEAHCLIDYFQQQGLTVQQDYGVVGFSGMDSAFIRPGIATLKVDTEEMGRKALLALGTKNCAIEELKVNVELLLGETI